MTHLITAGGQVFSEGLDGADLVVLYQLFESSVRLAVSRYDKQSILALGDNKMAAPVETPLEENAHTQEVRRIRKKANHQC